MITRLLAHAAAVEKAALFRGTCTTSTGAIEESAIRDINYPPAQPPGLPTPQVLLYSRSYVAPEPTGKPISSPSSSWTKASSYLCMIEPSVLPTKGIEAAVFQFARRLEKIPAVIAVSYSVDRNVYLIWTFITHRDKAVRRQIYEEELQLMRAFPAFTFDFNVVALDQLEAAPLVPDELQGWLVLYRQPRL